MDAELLKILACPSCRGDLQALPASEDAKTSAVSPEEPEGLVCLSCALVYPVRNSIPVLLKEEAVSRADWNQGLRRRRKK